MWKKHAEMCAASSAALRHALHSREAKVVVGAGGQQAAALGLQRHAARDDCAVGHGAEHKGPEALGPLGGRVCEGRAGAAGGQVGGARGSPPAFAALPSPLHVSYLVPAEHCGSSHDWWARTTWSWSTRAPCGRVSPWPPPEPDQRRRRAATAAPLQPHPAAAGGRGRAGACRTRAQGRGGGAGSRGVAGGREIPSVCTRTCVACSRLEWCPVVQGRGEQAKLEPSGRVGLDRRHVTHLPLRAAPAVFL